VTNDFTEEPESPAMDSYEWLTLDDGEDVVWTGRPRSKGALAALVASVVLAAAVGVALTVAVGEFLLVAASALAVLLAIGLPAGLSYVSLTNTEYVLTSRNVYRKSGILGTDVSRLPLSEVQNVDYGTGVLGNVFGYGTVEVRTAGGGNAVSLSRVGDPATLREELAARSRTESERTGGRGDREGDVDDLHAEARALRETAERLAEVVADG
jgi:uncharacterized membrane protein YdbT with pleckstrin-like domain